MGGFRRRSLRTKRRVEVPIGKKATTTVIKDDRGHDELHSMIMADFEELIPGYWTVPIPSISTFCSAYLNGHMCHRAQACATYYSALRRMPVFDGAPSLRREDDMSGKWRTKVKGISDFQSSWCFHFNYTARSQNVLIGRMRSPLRSRLAHTAIR